MELKFPFPAELKAKFAELEFRVLMQKEELFAKDGYDAAHRTETIIAEVKSRGELERVLAAKTLYLIFENDLHVFDGKREYFVRLKEGFFDEGVLYSEAVEAIEPGPVEGIRATGANKLEEILYGVLPQVMPP